MSLGNIRIFRNLMRTTDDSLRLCDIYKRGPSPVHYFNISKLSYQLLVEFREKNMGSSDLLDFYWKQNLNSVGISQTIQYIAKEGFEHPEGVFKKAFDMIADDGEVELNLPFNLSQVVMYLLIPSLNGTFQVMVKLNTGNLTINEAIKFTKLCKDFTKELNQLGSFFKVNISDAEIRKCSERLGCASNMRTCVEQSNEILETANVLQLCGDFTTIEKIRNKVCLFHSIIFLT